MRAVYPSPEETLPWLVRDASGRAVGSSHGTREDAEHAATKVVGGSVWRDNYSAANVGRQRVFLGVAPRLEVVMRRFGAWGEGE